MYPGGTMNLEKLTSKQKQQLYIKLYQDMCRLCNDCGWGDPFSYSRGKEIYMAVKLGHQVAPKLAGPDAYDNNGDPLEYKSTISNAINATYNGVSLQSSWSEQEKYLKEEKIGKYKEHYYARFNEEGEISEAWCLTGQQVLDKLLPKFKKQWHERQKKMPKDPRLGASVDKGFIVNNGVKII